MARLLVLYRLPTDAAAFMRHYRSVHLPLVRRLPGLRRLAAFPVVGAPQGGREYELVAELDFDSLGDLEAALRSPEGRAAGRDLANFASEGFKMMYLGADIAPQGEGVEA
jgi:uncharacterized protein (TIGR02118 family)